MKGHGIKTFGELNADRYDALYEEAMTKETQDSVETLVPDFSEYVDGQRLKGSWAKMDSARFEIAIQDAVTQTVSFQRIVISESGIRMVPHFMRYAWPSELDLMAQLAGLESRERWAWWDRSLFTADSKSHVTVYAKTDSGYFALGAE